MDVRICVQTGDGRGAGQGGGGKKESLPNLYFVYDETHKTGSLEKGRRQRFVTQATAMEKENREKPCAICG